MNLNFEPSLIKAIDEMYQAALSTFSQKKKEVDDYLKQMNEDEVICMKFLYAFMTNGDLLSYDEELIASYVKATLRLYEEIPYVKTIPAEIFLSYVLPHRVANENLDNSRGFMYEELAPRVKGKSMAEAALEVNYWCYEKATYIASDMRSLAPSGMCKSTRGRCGEESIFAVSAMRSVGIPARECYVPGWAHCDNNHAWVEIWADGKWHYIGGCEPEPVLNKGWFTTAASKAMVVLASAYSHFLGDAIVLRKTEISALINATETYGKGQNVTVTVTKDGQPLKDAKVLFQIINFSHFLPLHMQETDENGYAEFFCGNGDLYLTAAYEGTYVSTVVDTRVQTNAVLEINDGIRPEEIIEDCSTLIELNPPYESVRKAASAAMIREHEARLRHCEAIREAYEATFVTKSGISEAWDKYFEHARGNHAEIRRFYEMTEFTEEDKRLLLDTLREKDFVDCDADVLADYLRCALPYKNQYPLEIYKEYVLAPRIFAEMLTPCRSKIVKILKERQIELKTAAEVWKYMKEQMIVLSDQGERRGNADAAGCVYYQAVTKAAFHSVFMQICRALGIPVRMNHMMRKPEAILIENGEVRYELLEKNADEKPVSSVKLTLRNTAKEAIRYGQSFTLEMYEEDHYRPMFLFRLEIDKETTIDVMPGSYRLLTTMRQINGAVSARLTYFVVTADRTIDLVFCEDHTAEKMLHAALPDGMVYPINAQGEKEEIAVSAKSLMKGRKTLFILAAPGKEPTEHLLQEILELEQMCRENQYRIVLGIQDMEGMKNATLQKVLTSGLDVVPVFCTDEAYIYEMHRALRVGEYDLPFAAAINAEEEGMFAFANYNIRTAWRLMNILCSK